MEENKNFWVDFSASVLIRNVKNIEEAKEKFWDKLWSMGDVDDFGYEEITLVEEAE